MAYTADLNAQALPETRRPPGHVPCTTWWWVEGDTYLGRIALRHQLNANLLEVGGHIGYDVRPTARRRGHATAMLGAVLPIAHSMGIDPVLVTCDNDNEPSRRTIEHYGGVLGGRTLGQAPLLGPDRLSRRMALGNEPALLVLVAHEPSARAPGGRSFMQVEIFSDVVCPWCYIGKRRFEQALAAFPHRDEVEVTWRAFELDRPRRSAAAVP